MKIITVPKAVKILERDDIPDTEACNLIINGEVKKHLSLKDHQIYFQKEAEKVIEALNHLPQGIRFRVLISLMKSEADNFLGSYVGE